ncbi:GMC family oxidoreductase [Zavarzinia aquatilis]|uniref:Choline dehydrogenase n=1 Tax=Zavarzinia aquatilis TaxID=2211142 RepID=A0A317EIP5_9PROT|nr:choline dehydrogenase [Zavarzinia aquatilis]PWR25303.1 choline dehydrogenase [Zavarzinia aquatilis]
MPDYVIVGAGSAGCVLANRLSADPSIHVTLIEAGGRDRSFLYRIPAGFFALMKSGKGNWNYETVPQPGLGGRTMYFPRGKVLGGSSSINGLVVSRGNPGDYDRWSQLGNPGWSFRDCLPDFRRIEAYAEGDPEWRGQAGPITVSLTPVEAMNPISRAFIEGGRQAGFPLNRDVNAANPHGMAQMQGNYAHGERQSAAARYLRPALTRPNLRVITGALVTRVVVRAGRAVAVEYRHGGRLNTVEAEREVILAGGAVNSPQLLQLSGIGDPGDLRPHGIRVIAELPGVGRNLRDHLAISLKQRLKQPISLLSGLKPLAMARALGQYLLFRGGPAAVSALEAWAHLKSREGLEYPDLQLYCVPLMYNDHGRDVIPVEGFMTTITGLRSESCGRIAIRSADPAEAPAIDPRYLSASEDLRVLRDGIRLSRRIVAQPAFDAFRGDEYAPGAACTSDQELDHYIRDQAATLYHPVGTCRMGSDDKAVVDPQLKVRGIDGLRVVDASVMPDIVSGNTNFPTMMIAEKAARSILGQTAGP